MTNKQERFYVVSETELHRLEMAAYTKAALNSMVNLPIGVKVPGTEDAEAACRSRPVVEVASGVYETEEWHK